MMMVVQALAFEQGELEELSRSADLAEQAIGRVHLALLPEFRKLLCELNQTTPPQDTIAAMMQVIAQMMASLAIAYDGRQPRQLYDILIRIMNDVAESHLEHFEKNDSRSVVLATSTWKCASQLH
jgi:hypothetical protein